MTVVIAFRSFNCDHRLALTSLCIFSNDMLVDVYSFFHNISFRCYSAGPIRPGSRSRYMSRGWTSSICHVVGNDQYIGSSYISQILILKLLTGLWITRCLPLEAWSLPGIGKPGKLVFMSWTQGCISISHGPGSSEYKRVMPAFSSLTFLYSLHPSGCTRQATYCTL